MTTFVGSCADPTFAHLVTTLGARGVTGDVVDLGLLTLVGDLRLPLDGSAGSLTTDREVEVSTPVVARLIDLSGTAPTARLGRRARGVGTALSQYLRTLPWTDVVGGTWDNSNFSKAYQLALAADGPWSVPRSCVTNDPGVAARFLHSLDVAGRPAPAISKGCSSAKTWARTVTADDLARLPLLRRSPVLFQEQVGGMDVRVHVVAERVFGEAIRCDATDYRVATTKQFSPLAVPADVAAGCVALTRSMRLVLSGIDFKVTDEGRWYFLEANTAPCLQGYDRRARGAITDALADHLLRPRPGPAPAPAPDQGYAPVATGRSGSRTQSLQEPG